MIDAGVRVFKIEGRARSAEYVRTVTECYKQAIAACLEGTFTDEKIETWDTRLKAVFNRGFWDGYYLGQRLGEWSKNYGSEATKKKVYVGKVTNYFANIGVAECLVETQNVRVGEELLIIGPTTGCYEDTVEEIRVDLKAMEEAKKGDYFSLSVKEKVRRNDKIYKWEANNIDNKR